MGGYKKLSTSRIVALYSVVAVCVFFFAICMFNFYGRRLNNKIFEASSSNLETTYKKVGELFAETSRARWNYLDQIGEYLEAIDDKEEKLPALMEKLKESYGFTDFYMVSDSGSYITASGEKGYIDLGDNLFKLVEDGQNIVTDGSLPRRENMFFYAVKVTGGSYMDFDYVAVAFGYDKSDLAQSLRIETQAGDTTAYICYTNGRVAISMGDDDLGIVNAFTGLEDGGLSKADAEQTENDFSEGNSRTVIINIAETEYYMSYQPIGFQDWMLVCYTPAQRANLSMDDIRVTTSHMLIIILGVIIIAFVILALVGIANVVRRKNTMLAERELIFSVISENLNDIYLLINRRDNSAIYVSPNVERLLGVSTAQVMEDCFVLEGCCTDESKLTDRDAINNMQPGESFKSEATLVNKVTGEKRLFSHTMYRPEGKNEDMLVAIIADRTREQEVRGEIEDALTQARNASQAKSLFLSNMSHDIRTPMNAIVGFSTLLEKDANDPKKVIEHTHKIRSASAHLLGLINDVLDMSKIESGKTTLTLEELNMEELIANVESIIRSQAQAKSQSFELERKLKSNETVLVDRLRLSQILINILSNAVKYTPNGGRVVWTIISRRLEDKPFARYRFIVADNGVGMSEKFLETIYMPFTREEQSTTNKVQGTGLGMAITKNLVDMMGGTIHVESKQGEGSTFEVIIDFRITENKPNIESRAGHESSFSMKGMRVLAAEDNKLNAEILTELMSMEGVECDIAENGEEVLDKFKSSRPGQYDVILMDVQMPVMNGYAATRAIRALERDDARTIPILAMTANAFADDIQEALASGMNAHVSKPVDMDVLKNSLAKVLDKKQV